jgi:hypothetical protein
MKIAARSSDPAIAAAAGSGAEKISDPIEKSLKIREKEGNIQSVVKPAKPTEEAVFKLKVKGQIPEP